MNPFPEQKLTDLKRRIDQALSHGAQPIAAFDADGTLWNADLGENFFRYQIANRLVELPAEPWKYYKDFEERDTAAAYAWLAQINRGVPLAQLQRWADEALANLGELPIFPCMREIVDYLTERGVAVYIVTASMKWAVDPGAKTLGIPLHQVIGITTQVVNGSLTDTLDGAITWREGKVDRLLAVTREKKPFFAAGNTVGDLALLDCATHLRLVNAAAPTGHYNRPSEQKLVDLAVQRGWHVHVYNA